MTGNLLGLDTTAALSLIFLVVFLFYTIYSGFLIYHWYAFGYTKRINRMVTLTYLLGSGVLLFIMALAIFASM